MLHRVEKEVRFTQAKGRLPSLSVVREHYLREDISCKVDLCGVCGKEVFPQGSIKGSLDSKLLHYAVPDVLALSKFSDIFEHPSLIGCILLQTALNHIRTRGWRQTYARLKALLRDHDKNFVMFSNEYYYETYSGREKAETLSEWQERMVYLAATWYVNHLQHSNLYPLIVLVTPIPEHYSRFEKVSGLVVATPEGYLKTCWPELIDLQSLVLSLMESSNITASPLNTGQYTKYPPDHVIKENLKKGLLKSGRLHVSDFHQDEAVVSFQQNESNSEEDCEIFIPGKFCRNRAIHGDLVAVQILPPDEWCSKKNSLPPKDDEKSDADMSGSRTGSEVCTGMVVGIIERTSRPCVATLDESYKPLQTGKSERLLVVPYNRKIPKIRISTRRAEDFCNHRIVVQVDSWPVDSQYPNGHFLRCIGRIGDLETETEVILLEHELTATPFSKVILAELPDPSQWKVGEEEVSRRRDLRNSHLVLSIDPKGCEDVDDTLSVRRVKHGCTELGVHIADVTHFVRPGSLADQEAANRSTTIYLADRRNDMLPPVLSSNLCSLLSNVDRYAVSVLWTLGQDYEVKKVWFGRTIICSSYKLAYETAQDLLDDAPYEKVIADVPELDNSETPLSLEKKKARVEELRGVIKSIVNIARVLREKRDGLELEGVEVRVSMDSKDKTKVDALIPKQPLEVHEVIAECMIFANHWVAKEIVESFPTNSLLRHHSAPSPARLAGVVECAKRKKLSISIESNKALAHSLNAAVDEKDPEFNKVLKSLATLAMVPAHYFSTGSVFRDKYHHYGLDLDLYTHFTSPIRRYADVVVHRLLLAAVNDLSADDGGSLPSNKKLQEMCKHMNKKHRSAQLAQLASTDLFQGMYFASCHEGSQTLRNGRHEVEAVVVGIRSNGVIVFNTRYGIRGPVYLKDKTGLVAQTDPAAPEEVIFGAGSLTVKDGSVVVVECASGETYTIEMFDHVRIQVTSKVSHTHGYSLSLRLLKCGPVAPQLNDVSKQAQVGGNKELMKIVKKERDISESSALGSTHKGVATASMYHQSDPSTSLYCIIQKLNRLALQPF